MTGKDLNQRDIYSVLAACIVLIGGCVLLKVSLVYGFAVSTLLCCVIFIRKGFSNMELSGMIYRGVIECRQLYVLILLIGATVSIWLSSGVVPSMIYYGFEYMKGMNFLFAAFIIVSISAVFMGTAVGTVSTIGVAILGIGTGFGIPSHILLGAIVSGAFIADKISPISGLLNLTLTSARTNYREALKSMLVTLIPAIVLSAAIYYIIGISYTGEVDVSSIIEFQRAIGSSFFISPYLLLMPVLIVILSMIGVRTIYSILSGLFSGTVISFILQKMTLVQVINSIVLGYKGYTSSSSLNQILISGGVISMIEVLLIVIGAVALSSILEGTGFISLLTDKVISQISSKKELVIKTGFISSILTIATCDQTMGIVLPGRLMLKKYEELKVSSNVMARTISDTGTIIAPLMPWNVNSLIIGIVAGTATAYAPFAFLCYISPLITFIAASTAGDR